MIYYSQDIGNAEPYYTVAHMNLNDGYSNEIVKMTNGIKESDNMLEAQNIIKFWKNNKINEIKAKNAEEIKKYKDNNVFVSQFNAIVKEFDEKLISLYESQIPEGETKVDEDELALKRISDDLYITRKVMVNASYYDEKMREIDKRYQDQIDDVEKMYNEVSVMLGICNTREEILNTLREYGIIEKKSNKIAK